VSLSTADAVRCILPAPVPVRQLHARGVSVGRSTVAGSLLLSAWPSVTNMLPRCRPMSHIVPMIYLFPPAYMGLVTRQVEIGIILDRRIRLISAPARRLPACR